MNTTPDPQTVNELAAEVANLALHDAVHVDQWISAVVASRFGNECSQVRAPLHAAVARRMAGVKLAWTDEQHKDEPRDLFADIADITAWLDDSNPSGPHEDAMRVMKLGEEVGEAIAAYVGLTGQNPRKGVTHTMDELLKELADVAITALAAMQHFTQDETETRAHVVAKVRQIIVRSDIRTRGGVDGAR